MGYQILATDRAALQQKETREPWIKDVLAVRDRFIDSGFLGRKRGGKLEQALAFSTDEALLDRPLDEWAWRDNVWPERINHDPAQHAVIRTAKWTLEKKLREWFAASDTRIEIRFNRNAWTPNFVDRCSAVLIPELQNESPKDDRHVRYAIWQEIVQLVGNVPTLRVCKNEAHSTQGLYRVRGTFMNIGGNVHVHAHVLDVKRQSVVAANQWEYERKDHLQLAQAIALFVKDRLTS